MKNTFLDMRKLSAILLAVLLLCSVAAVSAFAAGNEPVLTFAAAGHAAESAAEVYAQNVNSMVSVTNHHPGRLPPDKLPRGGGR